MRGTVFMRMAKLPAARLVPAARHNLREAANERGARANIDPLKSVLNRHLSGPTTADAIRAMATQMMREAGAGTLRKNGVACVEVLFSLPVSKAQIEGVYFGACVAWAERHFGVPVLSADVHLDEAAPHCHVLLLPLVDGRMVGSDLFGGPAKLRTHLGSFQQIVAQQFGLRQAAQPRLSAASSTALSAAVVQQLNQSNDPAMTSAIWNEVRAAIDRDPKPFAQALSIDVKMPRKKTKTFVQIMTSTGKGPKQEISPGISKHQAMQPAKTTAIPYRVSPPAKGQTLSCVGFAPPTPAPNTSMAMPVTPLIRPTNAGQAGHAATRSPKRTRAQLAELAYQRSHQRLIDAIRANVGSRLSALELMQVSGLSMPTVESHIGPLTDTGHVVLEKVMIRGHSRPRYRCLGQPRMTPGTPPIKAAKTRMGMLLASRVRPHSCRNLAGLLVSTSAT
ncbi:MAG: plasmid recombination protein [Rubrivivax sp.]|nr:plasmid recombination protein [Rubrivivax sp.]